jgi:hypothetical protein
MVYKNIFQEDEKSGTATNVVFLKNRIEENVTDTD